METGSAGIDERQVASESFLQDGGGGCGRARTRQLFTRRLCLRIKKKGLHILVTLIGEPN